MTADPSASRENAPQVFISFKNLDANGRPTRDSVLARQVYDFLAAQGLRVFLSNVSLEQLGIAAYKRAVDHALDAARVLVAVGTSGENLDSQWVRYEWDSFLNDILSGVKPDGRVFTYVENTKVSSLPRALRQSQVFEHGPAALERLFNFVANALGARETDFEARIVETRSRLRQVLQSGQAWRIGLVTAWRAIDIQALICRISADWQAVAPTQVFALQERGWSGSPRAWGTAMDRPRVWRVLDGEETLHAVAEEVVIVHRIVHSQGALQNLVYEAVASPRIETPPWFIGEFMGGDLRVTCKQCGFSDDDSYAKYETKRIVGECPVCCLGRSDWFFYWHGCADRECKKCGHRMRGSAPPRCPSCGLGGSGEGGAQTLTAE